MVPCDFFSSDVTNLEMAVSEQIYCTSWVLTYFFHMASFYWMFIEGRVIITISHPVILLFQASICSCKSNILFHWLISSTNTSSSLDVVGWKTHFTLQLMLNSSSNCLTDLFVIILFVEHPV